MKEQALQNDLGSLRLQLETLKGSLSEGKNIILQKDDALNQIRSSRDKLQQSLDQQSQQLKTLQDSFDLLKLDNEQIMKATKIIDVEPHTIFEVCMHSDSLSLRFTHSYPIAAFGGEDGGAHLLVALHLSHSLTLI